MTGWGRMAARIGLIAVAMNAAPAMSQDRAPAGIAQAAPLRAALIGRWQAAEAKQGVAVDRDYFYPVSDSAIGKYDKRSGRKVGAWSGDGVQLTHINSCVVEGVRLICANSNFPHLPMASSVEFFDTRTMTHIRSVPLGLGYGSLTWIDRHAGQWWAGFANYDGKGGEPGRDHRFTQIVTFDDQWRRTGGYALPAAILDRMAPMSNSGGGWGGDGLLYLTGHDAPEIYVLQVPDAGPALEQVATIAAPLDGQAWAWDRSAARVLYGITRHDGEVVAMRLPAIPPLPRR